MGNPKSKPAEPESDAPEVGATKSVPDYTSVPALRRSKLADYVARHAEIDDEIKALEDERKELKEKTIELFVRNNVKSVMVLDRTVTRIDGLSVTYPIAKLVAAGVTDKQLAAAKTEKPWTSLKVGKIKGENGNDE